MPLNQNVEDINHIYFCSSSCEAAEDCSSNHVLENVINIFLIIDFITHNPFIIN